jgi:prepilin signal peptidase PulO-like enzyme (type II secretory pathway)
MNPWGPNSLKQLNTFKLSQKHNIIPREKSDEEKVMSVPGFGLRIGFSIVSFFALLVFLIVWLFFYAGSFSVLQNIAVVLTVIVIFIGVMAGAWVPWGIRYEQKYGKGKKKKLDKKAACMEGIKCHGTAGCIYGLGFLGALIYYVTTAPDFGTALLGVIKALLWPAFLVYGLLFIMCA